MYSKTLQGRMRFRRWLGIIVFTAGLAVGCGTPMERAMTPATPDAGDAALIRQATQDVTTPTHLAGIHVSKQKLNCQDCHGDNPIPDDTASKVNASCITCHGGYSEMAAISKKKSKNPEINVHASHLGPEVACTTCHQGHKESRVYCLSCHTNFDLPIPGGAAKK